MRATHGGVITDMLLTMQLNGEDEAEARTKKMVTTSLASLSFLSARGTEHPRQSTGCLNLAV